MAALLDLIHPGEVLADALENAGLSANGLAKRIHVPTNRVTAILNGQRGISGDTALRLSRFFGTTPQFWLNLQTRYELETARRTVGKSLDSIDPLTDAA